MPILYIHGVGIRHGQHSDEMRTVLKGIDWASVQGRLRQFIAPVLNPVRPAEVLIEEAYWGDLGAAPLMPEDQTPVTAPAELMPAGLTPAGLMPAALAEELEARLRHVMPMTTWPQVIEVAAQVAGDTALRGDWAHQAAGQQWAALQQFAETELHRRWHQQHPLEPWPWLGQLRQDVHLHLMQRVTHLRGPMEQFLPYFMGDILDYLLKRGTPPQPGPMPQRMLQALEHMQAVKRQTGEPIVILTHSMGGQLLYDALSAYAPAQDALADLEVDFWVAAASQLGLFASLNLFVTPTSPQGTLPPLTNLKYLWNAWSPTDLLSFQAQGAIPDAHDIAMSLTDDALQAHIRYIVSPLFYQMLASKLKVTLAAV